MTELSRRDKATLWQRAADIEADRRPTGPSPEARLEAVAEAVEALHTELRRLQERYGVELWRLLELANMEPWLNKKELAYYYKCSTRTAERWVAEGIPHAQVAGAVKFKLSAAEPWLEDNGHLVRHGEWLRP